LFILYFLISAPRLLVAGSPRMKRVLPSMHI
jgi:hypothetical protein